MNENELTCASCKFFKPTVDRAPGDCLRYPPKVFLAVAQNPITGAAAPIKSSHFPPVGRDLQACGEYQPALNGKLKVP